VETILVVHEFSRENRPQYLEVFFNSKKYFMREAKMGEKNLGL